MLMLVAPTTLLFVHPTLLTASQQSSKPFKVKALPTPGYIYLYSEDGTTAPFPAVCAKRAAG
jgi:hypothetical protein